MRVELTVRAFSGQGARIGFVDIDAECGAALAAELAARNEASAAQGASSRS